MSNSIFLVDAQNSSALTDSFSPGATKTCLLRVRAAIDTSTSSSPTVFLLMFDQASAPASGNQPVIAVEFVNGYAELDFGAIGRRFSSNAYFQLSTTPLTFTWAGKVGGGNLQALFDAQFVS